MTHSKDILEESREALDYLHENNSEKEGEASKHVKKKNGKGDSNE